jgi:hypothetical protein
LRSTEKLTQNGLIHLDDLPVSFSRHCSVKYNDTTILIIGGRVGDELFSSKAFFYSPNGGNAFKFGDGPSLNLGRQFHTCSRLGSNTIVVAGGRNHWGGLDSVEILQSFQQHFIANFITNNLLILIDSSLYLD